MKIKVYSKTKTKSMKGLNYMRLLPSQLYTTLRCTGKSLLLCNPRQSKSNGCVLTGLRKISGNYSQSVFCRDGLIHIILCCPVRRGLDGREGYFIRLVLSSGFWRCAFVRLFVGSRNFARVTFHWFVLLLWGLHLIGSVATHVIGPVWRNAALLLAVHTSG